MTGAVLVEVGRDREVALAQEQRCVRRDDAVGWNVGKNRRRKSVRHTHGRGRKRVRGVEVVVLLHRKVERVAVVRKRNRADPITGARARHDACKFLVRRGRRIGVRRLGCQRFSDAVAHREIRRDMSRNRTRLSRCDPRREASGGSITISRVSISHSKQDIYINSFRRAFDMASALR